MAYIDHTGDNSYPQAHRGIRLIRLQSRPARYTRQRRSVTTRSHYIHWPIAKRVPTRRNTVGHIDWRSTVRNSHTTTSKKKLEISRLCKEGCHQRRGSYSKEGKGPDEVPWLKVWMGHHPRRGKTRECDRWVLASKPQEVTSSTPVAMPLLKLGK